MTLKVVFDISDDDTCRQLLLEHGFTNSIADAARLNKGPGMVITPFFSHEIQGAECWAVVIQFCGYPKAADNGLSAIAAPKAGFSREEFQTYVEDVLRGMVLPGALHQSIPNKSPTNN